VVGFEGGVLVTAFCIRTGSPAQRTAMLWRFARLFTSQLRDVYGWTQEDLGSAPAHLLVAAQRRKTASLTTSRPRTCVVSMRTRLAAILIG
jgi:hypothetical protein